MTLRLHQTLKPRLVQDRMTTVYETIERPLVPVVAAMEKEGIGVDPEKLRGLSRDFTQHLAGLEAEYVPARNLMSGRRNSSAKSCSRR